MEDRSEIIVLAPYPVDIRKYYPNLEQDFHGICIAYTMVGREADAFKTAYQQVRNIYVHRLLYPGKNVLCQEDIAGMRTDFTVPHRKIEQMTELTGTAADEALTRRLSELFDRQKLVQYSIGYTLALCDTVYRAMAPDGALHSGRRSSGLGTGKVTAYFRNHAGISRKCK